MKVWIQTPSRLKTEALATLLTSFGFKVHDRQRPDTEVILCDLLSYHFSQYPLPSNIPTLAILIGEEQEVVEALLLGYRGYIGATNDSRTLKTALEAVHRGEVWAERRLIAKALDAF